MNNYETGYQIENKEKFKDHFQVKYWSLTFRKKYHIFRWFMDRAGTSFFLDLFQIFLERDHKRKFLVFED